VHLTAEGKKLVESILPKRGKVLQARMCVLGKRDQENLERLCRRLAEGDPVKFVLEVTMDDEDDQK
jgi:DNA-binding MarR family transcriptional regulator